MFEMEIVLLNYSLLEIEILRLKVPETKGTWVRGLSQYRKTLRNALKVSTLNS